MDQDLAQVQQIYAAAEAKMLEAVDKLSDEDFAKWAEGRTKLQFLADDINRIGKSTMETNAESAIEIGERLIRVKKLVGHGGFGDWLEKNFHATQQQASKYMRAAKHADALRSKMKLGFHFRLNGISDLLRLEEEPKKAKSGTINPDKPKPEPREEVEPNEPKAQPKTEAKQPSGKKFGPMPDRAEAVKRANNEVINWLRIGTGYEARMLVKNINEQDEHTRRHADDWLRLIHRELGRAIQLRNGSK